MELTPQDQAKLDAAKALITDVALVIRDFKEIPNGHLYALLMGTMDLHRYQLILDILKKAKLIKEESFLLTWIGPEIPPRTEESVRH